MDSKIPRGSAFAIAHAFTFSFLFLCAPLAEAAPEPTSDLLLPYFEVQLDSPGLTTLFSVVNTSDEAVPVIFGIHSNWGVEILQVPQVLAPHQSQSVNLRDWLVNGALPDGIHLEAAKLAHVQAALCGELSPEDGLYYSTEIQARMAVGYVTVRAQGSPRPDVLFGDFFVVDPRENFAQGERLINIDPLDPCGNGLCERHALRFLEGGGFDGGTELIVWTPGRNQPEEGPVLGSMASVLLDTNAFEEPGVFLGQRDVTTLPVQVVRVAELGFEKSFGWLEMVTEERSFVGVRYSANQRFSVGLVSTCLPVAAGDVHFDCEFVEPPASISIEKATNGHDADSWASAPETSPGEAITWTYVVTNDGEAALHDVSVADDDDSLGVSCPKTALEAGESMTCTAHGTAGDHSYQNVGLVTALSECDAAVLDSDPSHYTVGDVCDDSFAAAVSIETRVGGSDADASPGVAVDAGDTLDWEYVVTNMADDLVDVEVTDSLGLAIFCLSDTLASGASMTCTAQSTAAAGTHSNTGMVSAHTGVAECRKSASSADPAWYTGEEEEIGSTPTTTSGAP